MSQPVSVASPTPLDATQRLLAIGLVLGVTLVAFESTAALTSLPTIAEELGGDSLYGFALAAYTLANLVSLVAAGTFSDRRGPAPTFLIAVGVFIVGLVVSAAAPTMAALVLGRVLQGLGAGGFGPVAYALVKRAFPEDRQSVMYVFLSAGWVLPSLFAPFFGGFITENVGWRWVFAGIIPLALTVGAITSVPMRRFGPSAEGATAMSDRDAWRRVATAAAASVGVGMFILGLRIAEPLLAAPVAAVGIAVAVSTLRRLLPRGLVRATAGQPAVLTCRLLATATFIGVDGFVPLAADRIHGANATKQGLVITGGALAWTGGQALIAKRPLVTPNVAVRAGFAFMLGGTALVVPVLSSSWPLWATFLGWSVGGFGIGLLYNPTTVAAMSYASDGNEGNVSSQVQLTDALGFSLMGGIGGALVAYSDRSSWPLRDALATCFVLAALCALGGLVASRGVRKAPS
jgi:MFS family permease